MIRNIDFSMYSAIKIGPRADVFVIDDAKGDYSAYQIIGKSNNIILRDNHPPLAMLGKSFSYIHENEGKLFIGGATPNGKIFSFCKKNDIRHFEYARSLPGSLGGMVKMNAGMKQYEIFNHLLAVKTAHGYTDKKDIKHSYRHTDLQDIIYEAVFTCERGFREENVAGFAQMRKNQPQIPSAGSCFKNPKDDFAGRLIEAVGLRGHKIGNMSFSEHHANFLVNLGGGTSQDAIALIELAIRQVQDKFNTLLEPEIVII